MRSTNRLRIAIASAYPGEKWRKKVDMMPDYHVVAIYNHFVRDGVFNKLKAPRDISNECRQLSLWDYGIDLGVKKVN